jgi:uncharacterized membrane protein YphA (DoxX/SURF4 family)
MTRTQKIALHLPRILLGLTFTVFGLNKLLHFASPPPPTGAALTFFGGLVAAGYFLPLLAATEIAAGVLLLRNRFVPLALTLLAPVIVNILAFHAFLAPAGLGLPVVVLAAELALAWQHREAFAPMLRARTTTTPAAELAPAREPLRVAA